MLLQIIHRKPCVSNCFSFPGVHSSRWCGARQAVFWPELLPHHCGHPTAKRKVFGSDGSREMDLAPVLPRGLPLCGPLHSGQALQLWVKKRWLETYYTLIYAYCLCLWCRRIIMSGAVAPSLMLCPPSPPSKEDWQWLQCAGGKHCREAALSMRYLLKSQLQSYVCILLNSLFLRERSVAGRSCLTSTTAENPDSGAYCNRVEQRLQPFTLSF